MVGKTLVRVAMFFFEGKCAILKTFQHVASLTVQLIEKYIIKYWAMCRDNELQIGFTEFDQPCKINCQFNQMVIIKRADGVINEYIFKLIKFVGLARIRIGDIENCDDLI